MNWRIRQNGLPHSITIYIYIYSCVSLLKEQSHRVKFCKFKQNFPEVNEARIRAPRLLLALFFIVRSCCSSTGAPTLQQQEATNTKAQAFSRRLRAQLASNTLVQK